MVGEVTWLRCPFCCGRYVGALRNVPADDQQLGRFVGIDGVRSNSAPECLTCGAKSDPDALPEGECEAVAVHKHVRPTDQVDPSKHRGVRCWCNPSIQRKPGRVDVHHQDAVGRHLGGNWRVLWDGGVPDPLPGVAR